MGKQIVVFISGGGTNLQALIDAVNDKTLDCIIALVVSNREKAFGLERARKAGIPTLVKTLAQYKKDGKDRVSYDVDLAKEVLERCKPDVVVLAGFMHILSEQFINAFPKDSIINLHPALPGMFDGTRAIPRALEAFHKGEITHTGVMIHRCIPEVDRGTVIVTQNCEILKDDTIEQLEERMHKIEHEIIVQGTGIALMLSGTSA